MRNLSAITMHRAPHWLLCNILSALILFCTFVPCFGASIIVSDMDAGTITTHSECTVTQWGLTAGDASNSVLSADCERSTAVYAGTLAPSRFYTPFSSVTVYGFSPVPFQSSQCNNIGAWLESGESFYAFQCFHLDSAK